MPHRDLRFSHDYVEDAPPIVPVQGAVSGKAGGPVTDHSHTASGDGGQFDAANLRSDQDAEDGAVLSSDGEEGSEWRTLTLDSLANVNAPDPDDGDVPTWDDSAGEWVASPPAGGAMALDDLTDVDAAAPDDEDVLTWDDVAGKWVAAAPAGGAVDAGDVTYTPTTAADWDGAADPGDADAAFDQLAERVKDIEDAGGAGSPDASAVTYTPTTATDWDSDTDPGNVDDALDQLAERVADVEAAGGAQSAAISDWQANTETTPSTSNYTHKGAALRLHSRVRVTELSASANWVNGETFTLRIRTWNTDNTIGGADLVSGQINGDGNYEKKSVAVSATDLPPGRYVLLASRDAGGALTAHYGSAATDAARSEWWVTIAGYARGNNLAAAVEVAAAAFRVGLTGTGYYA